MFRRQVSVESLIEEYAGAYDDQEPRDKDDAAHSAWGRNQVSDRSSYEMRLRGLSGVIKKTDMDNIMQRASMEQGRVAMPDQEPLDETHTWQHVTSLPLSQQPSGTNSNSSVQLDGVSATVEEDMAVSARAGLQAGRASVRPEVVPKEVDSSSSESSSLTATPTQSQTTSRTASSANPDSRHTPVDQQDGPPSMWGNGPLFPPH
jgi:hypothetical protein